MDTATGVEDDVRAESQLDRVQGGKLHAVIGREAADKKLAGLFFGEEIGQAGGSAVAVVEKSALAVDLRIDSFAKDASESGLIQR